MRLRDTFAAALVFGFSGVSQANQHTWVPQPNFRIEDGDYRQTLIFIAGMSYAFSASNDALKRQNKQNFFCLSGDDFIGSKLLIDMLNEKLRGQVSSEMAVSVAALSLIERFPCQ